MAVEKVTVMVLKVDLQCNSCYKKAKRTLSKIPQIRDQIYNEKANTVTITVVCCSPERIRDKLCCRGGRSIKSVEIVEPPKPKPAETKKEPEKAKPAEAKKEPEKPKQEEKKVTIVEPKDAGKPEPAKNPPPVVVVNPAPAPVQVQVQKAMGPEPVMAMAHGVPSVFPYVGPGYDGYYSSGPYYHGYGYPVAAPPQLGYYGDEYGYGRAAHVNRSDVYFTEEEPGCSIM